MYTQDGRTQGSPLQIASFSIVLCALSLALAIVLPSLVAAAAALYQLGMFL